MIRCFALLGVLSMVLNSRVAAEPNERALAQLWYQHSTNASDHEALLASCQSFTSQNPSDPFVTVGQTLSAWNLLHLGRQAEAVAILNRHIYRAGTPLEDGVASLAKAWLTRMDRERVKAALQFYYRREVKYPRSLEELYAYKPLTKELTPLRQDRWDTNWRYALIGFKSMPGLLDQKYEISSSRLGRGSDLAESLAVPYGDLIHIRPIRMLSSKQGGEVVEWMLSPPSSATDDDATAKPAGQTVALGIGSIADGPGVVYIGRTILVVHDNYHFKIFVRPTR